LAHFHIKFDTLKPGIWFSKIGGFWDGAIKELKEARQKFANHYSCVMTTKFTRIEKHIYNSIKLILYFITKERLE
ncbi:hypothetical protein ACJX0J_041389, partial [Zea mays]